jgi:glycine cleavage system regulatory protein
VVVAVPDQQADALIRELGPLESRGLLDITVERAADPAAPADVVRLRLELVGSDRPGIVRDIASALAQRQVSIEELQTATREAPMAGGTLFEATATLVAPPTVPVADLQAVLEALADELMVDLSLTSQ